MIITFLVYSTINPDILKQKVPRCEADGGDINSFKLVKFGNGSGIQLTEKEPLGLYDIQLDEYVKKMSKGMFTQTITCITKTITGIQILVLGTSHFAIN